MKALERIIRFRPAWDRSHPDPKKNYGVHGVDLCFFLRGEAGVVQFVIYTGWHLPHVQRRLDRERADGEFPHLLCRPMAADLGYHSRAPRHEGHSPTSAKCEWIEDGPCYYDGSSLMAQELFEKFVAGGEEVVWERLERAYREWLETPPEPEARQ